MAPRQHIKFGALFKPQLTDKDMKKREQEEVQQSSPEGEQVETEFTNPVIASDEPAREKVELESVDDLQAQLDEITKKYQAALVKEAQEAVEHEEYPVATILLKVGHGNQYQKENLTPPEVAILAAMHHKSAGGNPVEQIRPTGTIMADPVALKQHLMNKYGASKVEALFPGPLPNFPKKFARALQVGLMSQIPQERLMNFHMQPQNAGSGE